MKVAPIYMYFPFSILLHEHFNNCFFQRTSYVLVSPISLLPRKIFVECDWVMKAKFSCDESCNGFYYGTGYNLFNIEFAALSKCICWCPFIPSLWVLLQIYWWRELITRTRDPWYCKEYIGTGFDLVTTLKIVLNIVTCMLCRKMQVCIL